MNAKVSVIVPAKDAEQFLPECLNSLVCQTLEEIEIIVIDAGSTDRTREVISGYTARYPSKIRSFIKEGGCLSEMMDIGIGYASGEFIGFVRGGDCVELNMYEKMYTCAVETAAEIVCCTNVLVENGTVTKKYLHKKEQIFGKSVLESPEILKHAKTDFGNKIYKRDFLGQGGYCFFSNNLGRDAAVRYEVLMGANKVALVDIPLYYRVKQQEIAAAEADDGPLSDDAPADDAALKNSVWRKDMDFSNSGHVFDVFEFCDCLLAAAQSRLSAGGPEGLYKTAADLCIKKIFSCLNKQSRDTDRKLLEAYIAKAYDYLDLNLPDWREYPTAGLTGKGRSARLKSFMLQHKITAQIYYRTPQTMKQKLRRIEKKIRRLFKNKKTSVKKKKKRGASPGNIEMLEWAQQLLLQIGVTAFADFRSLREILRQGESLTRLISAEIGVAAADQQETAQIRSFLEENGLKVQRQYIFEGQVVKEAYTMGPAYLEIHYYRLKDSCMRTWLPYKMPDYVYEEGRQYHLIELTSPSVVEVESIDVNGCKIAVPRNAEQLLEERYGSNWREASAPIAESSIARILDSYCCSISYEYIGRSDLNEDWFQRLNRYPLSLLRTLHGQYLEMLAMIDQICRENHLTWYLGEGTLLGAMRHHGFIPWDDDVDILMPKDDYDAFLQIAPKMIGRQYVLDHHSTKPKTPWIYAKLRFIGPCDFAYGNLFKISNEFGPDIDIFPLHTISQPYSDKQRLQKRRLTLCRRMLQYKAGVSAPRNKAYKKWKYLSTFIPAGFLHRRAEAMLQSFQEEGDYCANFMSWYGIQKQIFPKEYYGTPRYVRFEDMELPVPQKAEEILSTVYGPDWHQLPELRIRTVKHSMIHRTEKNRYEPIVIR